MTPDKWERIKSIYHDALEMNSTERSSYLDHACSGDSEMRREVDSLIAANNNAGDFIISTALKDAAKIMVTDAPQSIIGRKLGNYQVVSLLGSGGMGDVYLAKDLKLGREVAIKTVPPAFAEDSERLRRLENEARAAASLNHPNIATLYSVEEIDGLLFITMEHIDGQPMRELITPGGLHLDAFLNWFTQLADALMHAHEKGVIHRDIKPSNILITQSGVPKILDFGLARINRSEVEGLKAVETMSLTGEGVILGTPAYMSPEQAEGKEVDHRSDIFSFGVLMYEALTGRKPFLGDSYAAMISSILKESPVSVAELRSGLPSMLVRLIKRCLSKSRQHRYQTMREVRTVLEEVKAEYEANPPDVSYSSLFKNFRTTRGRPRYLIPAIVTCALLLAAAAAGWMGRSWFSTGNAVPVSMVVNTPPGVQPFFTEALLSPDGRMIAFSGIQHEVRQIYLRPIDNFEAQPVSGTEGGREPFFSPDSQWLAFFLEDGSLKKVPVTGGPSLTVSDPFPTFGSADWGEGDVIVSTGSSGLFTVSAGNNKPRQLTKLDLSRKERLHRYPKVLPGGKQVLFTIVGETNAQAAVASLSDGSVRILEDLGSASYTRYLQSGHVVFTRGKDLMVAPFDLGGLKLKGNPVPILSGVYFMANLHFSTNGTLLYLPDTVMNNNTVMWVDRSGQATPVLSRAGNYRSPKISPDGRRFAVQLGNDIWIYEFVTGRGLRLTFDGENQGPIWSPDGKTIAYSSNRNGFWGLYSVIVDQSAAPQLLLTRDQRIIPYSWNPRDSLLTVMYSMSATNTDIGFLKPGDTTLAPFLNSPFIEDTPRISNDGRWMVYFSNETGVVEVYVVAYPDGKEKIPISRGGGMYPVWSQDGTEVFYRRNTRVYAVPVETKGTFIAGTPRVLFEGRYLTGFDVSPDGSRFLMIKNDAGTLPSELHVIVNWADGIDRWIANTKKSSRK